MPFQYLTNLPLDEARKQYLDALRDHGLAPKEELIPTTAALDRRSAHAVYAVNSAPHYNACAMDGIALVARKTFVATETSPIHLQTSDFVWVNTGDPLPEDCDAVVMIEDVIELANTISLNQPAIPWQHIRQIGEDISAGDMIIPSFTEFTPAVIGALLAAGVMQVEVIARPLIGIIPTGDELVAAISNPQAGQIIEFNSSIFSGMFTQWGCETKTYPIAKDTQPSIEAALRNALSECDAVILNAGSSAGAKDYAVDAMRAVGEVLIHGIAIKPGKPAILALAASPDGERVVPMLGLPGYPVSGILVLQTLFKPVVDLLTCTKSKPAQFIEAQISRRLTSTLKYHEFIRARLGRVEDRMIAVPLNRGAGVVSSFIKADGIIHVPQDVEGYEAGESVRVELLRGLDEIEHSLVITGSHDPLLDEIADIMTRRWTGSRVASSHVGSMGGIMALKRGEAHLGGIHLLDEATGAYNIPFLQKYFPQGGVQLVSCVKRSQGLMVAPGNPLNVKTMADLAGKRFVNRQPGSGTRILVDYLVRQLGIDQADISGYEREEFTHTAVAAAIAAGTADAGMGILAAAKIFGLGFVPIAEEDYDLLIADSAMELDMVQKLLEVLRSQEFSDRLEKLGGYQLNHPGEVKTWH